MTENLWSLDIINVKARYDDAPSGLFYQVIL